MSVVVGTAGHIDHGKSSLLRALTGIDADRLPEERRRGMTIDVGYAHLALPDGDVLDFIDVPGHDRLVGNMLVGAGEIDAAMLVVAADDGPRMQTAEHVGLLDALGIDQAIVVVTKVDLLVGDEGRRRTLADDATALLARTSLCGAPVLFASAVTGEGLAEVRAALASLRDRVRSGDAWADHRSGPARLGVDRSFVVKGRGRVVTGTLRGGRVAAGDVLRVLPAGDAVRVREVQVRGAIVTVAVDGGRVALNVAGGAAAELTRGDVLVGEEGTADVAATRRILVALRPAADPGATGGMLPDPGTDGATYRLSIGTAQADATVRRSRGDAVADDGTLVTRLHLASSIAAAGGDRFALRRPSPAATAGGGIVLDPVPPAGPSRRHARPETALALRAAIIARDAIARDRALLDLHGVSPPSRLPALAASLRAGGGTTVAGPQRAGPLFLSAEVAAILDAEALGAVATLHASRPDAPGLALADARRGVARALRRRATVPPAEALAVAAVVVDALVAGGRLARDGDLVRDPDRAAGPPPALAAAMGRLEASLATPTPPPFAEAVRAAGCSPEGVRALEQSGRIVRLEADLAFSADTYRGLAATALALARRGPLMPAAYRDATSSSRKYALAILEDLDRRQILRRTPEGHVPGPRAPQPRPAAGDGR